ncbi:MAG: UMP kinase [Candidatus Bathyarchaeia archaeon]
MGNEWVVIKLGGHAFSPKPQASKLAGYKEVFRKMADEGYRLVIVAGGGEYARGIIQVARSLGVGEAVCDELGIEVSRINAELLISAFGEEAYPTVPKSMDELKIALLTNRIVVSGGMFPAQSTDAVSAIAAELVCARLLVKATDVEGIYTSDPKRDPNARKLDEVNVEELKRILFSDAAEAGKYELLDLQALRIITRSKIPTVIVDGRDPGNILKAVKGFRVGTRITFE